MATGTADGARPSLPKSRPQRKTPVGVVEYDRFVESHLKRTSSQVRGADLFGSFLTLAAGSLVLLLAAVLVDHWIVPGGLWSWGRWLAFALFLGGVGAYFGMVVLPQFVRRINPVYAAHTIEQGQPALKNSLINLLLLKPKRAGMPAPVFDAIEEQAATSLARTTLESSVDRSRIIKIGMVLLGVVVACALYVVLSPKDPLKSAARVIMPWADIARPTRITIDSIQIEVIETGKTVAGGDATVTLGQHVKISARVRNRGVSAEVPALVRFSSLEGREIVDQQISMSHGEYDQFIVLPNTDAGSGSGKTPGLQQGIEYTIGAGDTVRGPFKINVVAAPIIEVTKLEYRFPAYTRLPGQDVAGGGDIRALEGTNVTVHARANQEIRSAYIDFDCDGHSDRALTVSGNQASISFSLRLREDRRTPLHDSYLLRFTNQDGHENRQPVRYRIAVTPDLPPEIEFVAPEEPEQPDELAVNAVLPMAVRATDRDFDLAGVVLRAELQDGNSPEGRKRMDETLLDEPRIDQFRSEPFGFVPLKHGFEAGDTVVYWAEARDNRHPEANLVQTRSYTLKIVAPPDDPSESNPQDNAQRPPDTEQDDAGGRENRDKPRQGDPNSDEQSEHEAGENGDQNSGQPQGVGGNDDAGGKAQKGDAQGGTATKPDAGDTESAEEPGVDPDSQDGDAFERIMEHLDQQQDATGGQNDGSQENRDADQEGADASAQDGSQGAGSPTERQDPQDSSTDSEAAEGSQNQSPADQGVEEEAPSDTGPDGQPGSDSAAQRQPSDADQSAGAETDTDQQSDRASESDSERQAADSDNADGTPKQSPGPPDNQMPPQGRDATDSQQREPDSGGQEEGSQTGASEQPKGSAGDGSRTKDDTRSPDTQGGNKPRDKQSDDTEAASDGTRQPADSPSNSDHESDTEGDESGDQSGEGKEGGGQRADQEGSGAAGQNREADQGAGAAEQPGEGETSSQPGEKQPSDRSSEDPQGQTPGDGEKSRQGNRDSGGGDKQDQRPSGDQQPNDPSDPKERRESNDTSDGQPTQQPRGDDNSGQNGSSQPSGSTGEGTTPGEDRTGQRRGDAAAEKKPAARGTDPNLEYANKATDLALEKLKDQLSKDQADQELLDKLKWSREDLQRFVERWEKMKQAANAPGTEGKKASDELDAALRSLGLRKRATSIQGSGRGKDSPGGARQSGRSQPPADYSELYRQYTTGTSKGLPSQRK